MPEEVKNEITNAVIATKLDGFKELTDTKFKNVEDTLKRIELANSHFVTKIELDDVKKDFANTVKEIRDGFIQHNIDDKESFGSLDKGQQQVRDTLLKWGGALAVVLFILSFLSPVILKYWFNV